MAAQTVKMRIEALRSIMREKSFHAVIIPTADPHLSEYVAPHWKNREWISGFTGSAGTVVVTLTDAGLWTDSRYFLQAAEQLEGSGIRLFKEGLPETPSITQWLAQNLNEGDMVAYEGFLFSHQKADELSNDLLRYGLDEDISTLPWNRIWTDRPTLPSDVAQVYPLEYAGKDVKTKLQEIRAELDKCHADALFVPTLDEIAWTLNLRGTDIHCNPVVICHLYIDKHHAHLFIDPQKVTPEVKQHLEQAGVTLHTYAETEDYLYDLTNLRVMIDFTKVNQCLYYAVEENCRVKEGSSPIAMLKAVRNKTEQQGIRQAMQRDGVALVKFLHWLEKAVPQGGQTEMSIDRKLHEFRAAQPLYVGESFDTIAGYGPHAAIVHYEATPESDVPLEPHGLLLLDSGAQYLDGTTDITRTIALGPLTQEEKEDYTLILKGHIDLAMAVFPKGTRGAQLDVLARYPIWQHRYNYLHGTGHGVGHYLNVHEGPQSIRMNENPVTLQEGMVTSNEPGLYKAGSHGIRTENLVLCVPAGEGMFGDYLQFETLTLCPIDKRPIIKSMLTKEEIQWLNAYHRRVYDLLSPSLDFGERYWLAQATSEL